MRRAWPCPAEPEVAVAAIPARDLVAGNGIHLHLEREQVVAALDPVVGDVSVAEEAALKPLAHQPALHVRERDDDVSIEPSADPLLELLGAQHD